MKGIAKLELGFYSEAQSDLREVRGTRPAFDCYLGHALLHTDGVTDEVKELAGGDPEIPNSVGEIVCLEFQVQVALLDGRSPQSLIAVVEHSLDRPEYRDSVSLQALSSQVYLVAGEHETAVERARIALNLQRTSIPTTGGEQTWMPTELALIQALIEAVLEGDTALMAELDERMTRLGQAIPPDSRLMNTYTYLDAMVARAEDSDGQAQLDALRNSVRSSPIPLQRQTSILVLMRLLIEELTGPDPSEEAAQELLGYSQQMIEKGLSRTHVRSGYASMALSGAVSGNDELAIAGLQGADSIEQQMAWDYFQHAELLTTAQEEPAGPGCSIDEPTQSCRPAAAQAADLLGTWDTGADGLLHMFAGSDGLIYGVYEARHGELIGRMDGARLVGLWCDTSKSQGRQGGVFELQVVETEAGRRLDGRWHHGLIQPRGWQDDWDLDRAATAPRELRDRASTPPTGC